jgi:large conductance mechanosensitive channel
VPDEKKSLAAQFREFILRGNVVDLAVAVVIGAAFGAVINALVKDILTPFIAAIFGKPNFSNLTFTIHHSRFLYGDLFNAIISFLSIAAAIFFFVVKPLNYITERRNRALAEGVEPDPASLSDEAVLLTEIRDLLRDRAGQV